MPWREVKVGQVLRVNDDELFPADLLCLASALPDNVCFIKTTNLDGESNLKIRRPIDTTAVPDDSGEAQVLHTRATLHCEGPNADLHNFNGRFDADVVAGQPCSPLPDWSRHVSRWRFSQKFSGRLFFHLHDSNGSSQLL